MSYKRVIPCIFIDSGKAVKWFDDRTVLSEDVLSLAGITVNTEQMSCLYLICLNRMKSTTRPLI